MMRGLPWLTLVLGLALPACGGTTTSGNALGPSTSCAQVYALLRFTPSQVEQDTAARRCVQPNLAFSGELQGQARAAHIDQPCTTPLRGASLPTNSYDLQLAGRLYALRLNPSATLYDRRPATIVAASQTPPLAEVDQSTAAAGGVPRIWLATKGTLAVDSTGTAGTVDLLLRRDV